MDHPSKRLGLGAAGAALLTVFSVSREARAIECSALSNPIYAIGGSSPTPIFKNLGLALSKQSTPVTFIYQSTGGACSGVNAIINNVPISGNGTYWASDGSAQPCTFTVPQTADIGVGGNYPTLCPGITSVPAGVGDFLGPVQAFEFIVPYQSTQTVISAEAAYFVFGFNAGSSIPSYPVAPWTKPASIITRNNQSAAAIIIALALGVPLADLTKAGSVYFTDGQNNPGSLSAVATATDVEATLGFVSAEVAEGAPANQVKTLAYQHYKQQCGWLPNSTPTKLDKLNVRNGHYPLWANIHFLAAVDGNKAPTNPNAQKVIGWFRGTVAPPPGVDIDTLTTKASAVLDCAMQVRRTTDAGPQLPYTPAAPCGCWYEATATGATQCQACTTDASCPSSAPNCRRGYCEAH